MLTWGCCRYHQWDNFQDSGFQQTLGKKAQAMQFSLYTERSIMVIKHQKSDSDRFYLCNSRLDHRNYGCGCSSCLRQIRVGGDKLRLGRSKHKCQVQPQVKKTSSLHARQTRCMRPGSLAAPIDFFPRDQLPRRQRSHSQVADSGGILRL